MRMSDFSTPTQQHALSLHKLVHSGSAIGVIFAPRGPALAVPTPRETV